MKNLKKIAIVTLVGCLGVLTSCEINEVTEVREITETIEANPNIIFERNVNFNFDAQSNQLGTIINYPSNFQSREDDLVIVFLQNGIDNTGFPLWDALPRTFFLDDRQIIYNFNYSVDRIEILIDDSNRLDRTSIPAEFTDNQLFRIAVLPGQFSVSGKILNSADLSYDTISSGATFMK